MVPFSIYDLNNRFPNGIFSFPEPPDTQIRKIKFAIFSRRSQRLFRMGISGILAEKRARLAKEMSDRDVANACLETLTSTLEPVNLKLSKADYDSLNSKLGDVKQVYLGSPARGRRAIFRHFGHPRRLNPTRRSTERGEMITEPMIFLCTRISSSMLDFPYGLLNSHPQIVELKHDLLTFNARPKDSQRTKKINRLPRSPKPAKHSRQISQAKAPTKMAKVVQN